MLLFLWTNLVTPSIICGQRTKPFRISRSGMYYYTMSLFFLTIVPKHKVQLFKFHYFIPCFTRVLLIYFIQLEKSCQKMTSQNKTSIG